MQPHVVAGGCAEAGNRVGEIAAPRGLLPGHGRRIGAATQIEVLFKDPGNVACCRYALLYEQRRIRLCAIFSCAPAGRKTRFIMKPEQSRLGNIKTKHPTVKPVEVMTHTRGTGGNHD